MGAYDGTLLEGDLRNPERMSPGYGGTAPMTPATWNPIERNIPVPFGDNLFHQTGRDFLYSLGAGLGTLPWAATHLLSGSPVGYPELEKSLSSQPETVGKFMEHIYPVSEEGKTSLLDAMIFAKPAAYIASASKGIIREMGSMPQILDDLINPALHSLSPALKKRAIEKYTGPTIAGGYFQPKTINLSKLSGADYITGKSFNKALDDMVAMYPELSLSSRPSSKQNILKDLFQGQWGKTSGIGFPGDAAKKVFGVNPLSDLSLKYGKFGAGPQTGKSGGVWMPGQGNIGLLSNVFGRRSFGQHELLHATDDIFRRNNLSNEYDSFTFFNKKVLNQTIDAEGSKRMYKWPFLKHEGKLYKTEKDMGRDIFKPIELKIRGYGKSQTNDADNLFWRDEGEVYWKYIKPSTKKKIAKYENDAYEYLNNPKNFNTIDKKMSGIEPWWIKERKLPYHNRSLEYITNPTEIGARIAQLRLKSMGWGSAEKDLLTLFDKKTLKQLVDGVDDAGNIIRVGSKKWGGSKSSIGLSDSPLIESLIK